MESGYIAPALAHTEIMASIRLGTNLRAVLEQKRLSLKQVSAQTGIPYSTLHTWLENRQPKDILKVKRLADYLQTSLTELLFGEPEGVSLHSTTRPTLPGHSEFGIEGTYEITIKRRE
ncbi:MAG: helix-turn-helix transcriptional regulator [Calothrix sp. SM1_5_4]|nr:helix-turn-helix transcriptional regulator [Calothrix sp. SM1_5_4]